LASSTPNTLRRPSQLIPIATSTARDRITPSSRTFSYRASSTRYGYSSSSRRRANAVSTPSSPRFNSLIVPAENACPHNSSVIAFTFRVDTPITYISASAVTNACSLR